MPYGLLQYYNDELAGWNRSLVFHKAESRELLNKIAVVRDQQTITSAKEKESSSFIDQFMVQQQEFDHITNQISSQKQRLEKNGHFSGMPTEDPISQQQDSIRSRMRSTERHFISTKYTCSIFLSSFLIG